MVHTPEQWTYGLQYI